jgi:hypothetical protein
MGPRVGAAVAEFGAAWVGRALGLASDRAARGHQAAWGLVLSMLRTWTLEGGATPLPAILDPEKARAEALAAGVRAAAAAGGAAAREKARLLRDVLAGRGWELALAPGGGVSPRKLYAAAPDLASPLVGPLIDGLKVLKAALVDLLRSEASSEGSRGP